MDIKLQAASFLAAGFVLSAGIAQANPIVKASISQAIVSKDTAGKVVVQPVTSSTVLKPGVVIEYTITAANSGTDAARNLKPAAKIPTGTAFAIGSAHSSVSDAKPEFSLDNGKTWSAVPMVAVKAADGTMSMKPADPATFKAIRWSDPQNLASNAQATFVYDVTVR